MEAVALAKLQAADSMASGGAASSAVSSLADSASTAVQSGTAGSAVASTIVTKTAAAASWRPGLFQIIVGGRVSDVLGLGKYAMLADGFSCPYQQFVLECSTGCRCPLYTAAVCSFASRKILLVIDSRHCICRRCLLLS